MYKHKLDRLKTVFDQAFILLQTHPAEANTYHDMLALLGPALGCDWGTFWKVDPHIKSLRPAATWAAQGVNAPKLEKDTRDRTLSLSEGTAGHVWRSQKPLWTVNLTRDMCLPRSLDAAEAGLQGGIWFALKTETAAYGVIELLGRDLAPGEPEVMAGIELLGIQLGAIIEKTYRESR